jgi:predicted nuclease of restriction endonuclease-like (RecB) superfamily
LNGYSRSVREADNSGKRHAKGRDKRRLEREIDSALFERKVLSPPIVSPAVAQLYPTAAEVLRDTYVLDFLNLPEPHSESDLQRGLVRDIRRFLQALGPDFCFIGEEYRIQVGGKDFFLDLLFYHCALLPCIGVLLWLTPPVRSQDHSGDMEPNCHARKRPDAGNGLTLWRAALR